MLVQCPCGKKLKVKDGSAGKKIRCPACQEVFLVQEEESPKEEDLAIQPAPKKGRPGSKNSEPPPKKKAKAARAVEEEEEDEDQEEPRSKRKKATPEKQGVSLARIIVSAVVLVVLLGVLGVVLWRKMSPTGIVSLDLMAAPNSAEVLINGKKIAASKGKNLEIDLQPGTHEIKVAADGFSPFIRQVVVKAKETTLIEVHLKKSIDLPASRLSPFVGTWVLTYSNKVLRVYTVMDDGKVIWEQRQRTFSLSLRGEDVILEDGPVVERLLREGDKLRIDHFNPGTRYPDKGPTETAEGVKKSATELLSDAQALRALQGTWKISYNNQTQGQFTVDAEGRLKDGGRLVVIKGRVLLFKKSGKLERLTLEGNQLQVEHYDPNTRYVEDPAKPQVLGTGVRQ